MGILTIAELTFHEARRRKVLLAAAILGVLFVVTYGLGFYYMHGEVISTIGRAARRGANQPGVSDFWNVLVLAGLYAVNFMAMMMAVLMPVDTLSGEIGSGAIQTLVTKPLRRGEIVLGKWLGFWVILALYLLLMVGGVLAVAWAVSGYVPPNVPAGLALMLLEATLLMTVSIAGGTRLSTLANGVMVFGLYGLAFVGSWIERIGALLANDTAQNIGVLSSLAVPSEALWQMAAHQMQAGFLQRLPMTPFASGTVPSPAMALWAGAYILAAIVIAVVSFSRRDL